MSVLSVGERRRRLDHHRLRSQRQPASQCAAAATLTILLDLITDDPRWAAWSLWQLETASLRGPLLVNDIVHAELSVRFTRIEGVEAFLAEVELRSGIAAAYGRGRP